MRCSATAYVTLLTAHKEQVGQQTALLSSGSLSRPISLLLVLLGSLRDVERCRRDFVVLLGTDVKLANAQRLALENAGAILRLVPPLVPGVPTVDKLHVWTLTEYRRVMVLDADVMALRPLDALFEHPDELVIAHHAYDQLQAQCGIGVRERGVAALFLATPSHSTFDAVLTYALKEMKPSQLLYADQTGLMCFFRNRTRTLPCAYVYDVSYASGMPRYVRNCRTFGARHVRSHCLATARARGDDCGAARMQGMCDETRANLESSACSWAATSSEVHAVHFKGRGMKPWAGSRTCRFERSGMPRVEVGGGWTAVSVTDTLRWEVRGSSGACVSAATGEAVRWAREGDGWLPQKCCGARTLLSARWYALSLSLSAARLAANTSQPQF